MLTPLERVNNLIADLRYAQVDFDALFAGKNSLTPLESVELFLAEQQMLPLWKSELRICKPRRPHWPRSFIVRSWNMTFLKRRLNF